MKPVVGQVLYFVGSNSHHNKEGRDVTVTRVGRKWATLDNGYRISVDSWRADGNGYQSPGRCYVNRDAHWHETKRVEGWNALHTRIRNQHSIPDGVTTEQIEQASVLLGLDISKA